MAAKPDTPRAPAALRPGLRDRKRKETRERLTRAAKALFLKRGYEATTLDDIAAAADVSRRTFFHYFKSKEDVVAAWQDEFSAALVDAVAARPQDEPLMSVAENALIASIGRFDREEATALGRLIQTTPALRARDQAKYEGLERALAAALASRPEGKRDPLQARFVAMATIGALRIAGEQWRSEGGREALDDYARRVFRALRGAVAGPVT
jgi:AcrR family transcriptional regulator